MAFKIPNKNKKKRKVNTTSNTARRINVNRIINLPKKIPNHSVSDSNDSINNIASSSSKPTITSSSTSTIIDPEKIINTNKDNNLALKNNLLNNPNIPDKLKKLFRVFQTINKYYTLKQSRNTELFVFENYKSIIENELKCEVDPIELAQIAGISPNNFKLQYLPLSHSFIPNSNDILTSSLMVKTETIENHSIIKKEEEEVSSFEAVALIIHLEGHFKRLPRKDGSQVLLKYGQLLKERNEKVNNDFKIFYIKVKRGNKKLEDELAKFKLSPIYIKYLDECKKLLERKTKEQELRKKQSLNLIKKEEGDSQSQESLVPLRTFIDGIKDLDFYEGQLVYEQIVNPRLPKYDSKPISEYTHVLNMLKRVYGIDKLYSHQMKAIYQIWQGNNVVVTTYTSSGKSLIYQIPIIGALERDRNSKALLIFPTKALTQDQHRSLKQKFQEMDNLSWVISNIYDGDTTTNYKVRREIAETSHVIFTNPDMLHKSLLPHHRNWKNFFSNLKFVIVDEIHSYTHAFGTHCALIMRRLRRICEFYGNTNIQFIGCSATIENAKSHAESFFNINNVVLINEDGSPSGLKYHLFWDPIQKPSNKLKSLIFDSDSSLVESGRLFMELLLNNSRCIAFCKTKKKCEILLEYVYKEIEKLTFPLTIGEARYDRSESLKSVIMGYRAGYSANERRDIESSLFHGYLKGVISTTALELGIDIGSLDAVIHLGFPYSVAGYFQQAGRAGRRGKEAVTILVAENGDIMDRYYINNPKEIFNEPLEYSLIYPYHDIYLRKHIQCAANEIPIILENETYYFGDYQFLKKICDEELIKDERKDNNNNDNNDKTVNNENDIKDNKEKSQEDIIEIKDDEKEEEKEKEEKMDEDQTMENENENVNETELKKNEQSETIPDERETESKEGNSESKVKPETIVEKIKIESLKDDINMENSLLYMKDNSKSKTMDNNITYDDNSIYYCHPRFKNKPERYFSIRNIEERDVHIINAITQEELEAIETSRLRFYHEHAVFLFKGKSYQVIESDEERKYVLVSPVNLDYITRPANRKIVTINSVNKIIKVNDQLETKYGGVRVQTIIYGYYKLNPYTSKILSREQLPNRSIFQNTYGFWIDIPFDLVSKIGLSEKEMLLYAHGVHAIQHVMLYALPIIILNLSSSMDNLFQMNCSIPKVNSAENLRIMLYEKKGCGVLSETISRHIPYLLAKVLAVIKSCDCDNGCPNCIQTPHCYRKNQDLSKKYAIEILKCLCASFT